MAEGRRSPAPFLVAVLALVVLAWAALAVWGHSPHDRYLTHHVLEAEDPGEAVLGPTLFVGGWTLMVVAMMLPTSLPLVTFFATFTRERADRTRLLALLLLGYLAVWVAFGAAVLAADWGLHAALRGQEGLAAQAGLVGAAVLVGAGAYQFTPLKYHCLSKCRSPRHFVLGHWRGRDHQAESLRLGVDHGIYCVGCCWTLMVVMFLVGLGSLAWMMVLGIVMGVEKNHAWGRRLSAPLGVLLIGGGLVLAAGTLGLLPWAAGP